MIISLNTALDLKILSPSQPIGLFILFLVGIMLISDGGHQAHLKIFGHAITSMNKTTFYFILVILILVDVVQTAYQKNILKGKS